ncbi:MAG: hypothetical protein FWG99_05665 [Treponema sp.]|nr:hypothetical protein [Treponema sp.]
MSLKEALTRLETLVSSGNELQSIMAFTIPYMETLRSYHEYIEYFNSLQPENLHGNMNAKFKVWAPLMEKANDIFPEELWTSYWFAKMYILLNEHNNAYEHLKIILHNPLIFSMQIYPETLELSAQCADMLRLHEQANAYRNQKASLWNEYSIDVDYFSLFLEH